MKPNRLPAILGMIVLGCTSGSTSRATRPDAVVLRYFQYLQRDPTRAFLLLGDGVQRESGLRIPLSASLDPKAEPEGGAPSIADSKIAWLDLQRDAWLRAECQRLRASVLDVATTGDGSRVRVRVLADGAGEFEQSFELERVGDEDDWLITRISQRGLAPPTWGAAFAAAPSAEGLRHVQAIRVAMSPSAPRSDLPLAGLGLPDPP